MNRFVAPLLRLHSLSVYYLLLLCIACINYGPTDAFQHQFAAKTRRWTNSAFRIGLSSEAFTDLDQANAYSQQKTGNNKGSQTEAAQNKLSTLFRSKGLNGISAYPQILVDVEAIAPSMSPSEVTILLQNFYLLKVPKQSKESIALSRLLLLRLNLLAAKVPSQDIYHCLRSVGDAEIQISFRQDKESEWSNLVDILPKTLREVKIEFYGSFLTALGRLGMQWGDASEAIQQAIMERLEKDFSKLGLSDLCFVLHGLSTCKVPWTSMSSILREKVFETITTQIGSMRALDVPLLLQPLSKLGIRSDNIPQKYSDTLVQAGVKCMCKLSPQGISQLIVSMARMGMRPFADSKMLSLTVDDIGSAYKAMEVGLPGMTTFELCSLLLALKDIGCKIDGKGGAIVPPSLLQAIFVAIEKESARLSAQNAQAILTSVIAMGVKWKQLPSSLQASLLTVIQREGRNLYPGSFVEMLCSLKTLKAQLGNAKSPIERNTWISLLDSLERNLPHLSFHRVCNALVAIGELGGTYASFPASLRKALDVHLQKKMLTSDGKVDNKDVDSTSTIRPSIESFSSMLADEGKCNDDEDDLEEQLRRLSASLVQLKVKFSDLSTDLKNVICESIKQGQKYANNRSTGQFSPTPHYSSNFYTLGVMWGALDRDTRIALQLSVANSLQGTNALQARRQFGALVMMEAGPWGSFVPELKSSLLSRADAMFKESLRSSSGAGRMTSAEVALIFSYLYRLHMHWSDFPPNLKQSLQTLLSDQTPQGGKSLPSVLNSLGRLGIRWDTLLPKTKDEFLRSIEGLGEGLQQQPIGPKGRAKESTGGDEEFAAVSLANLCFGFAAMDVRYSILPPKVRYALKLFVVDVLPRATTTQYANILNSMGKMEVSVGKRTKVVNDRPREDVGQNVDIGEISDEDKAIDASLKAVLLKELEWRLEGAKNQEKPMNEQHLSNAIFAMGSIGISWQELHPETRTKVGDAICRLLPPSDQDTSGDSAPLPTTKYYGRISRDVKLGQGSNGKDKKIIVASKTWGREYFGTQGLSMLIVGLSRMGASWVELPSAVRTGLLGAVAQLIPEMRPPHISLTCLGFYELQLFWKQIDESITLPLLNALQRLTTPAQSSLPDLSFALVSLGKIGLTSEWIQAHHSTLLDDIIRGMTQLMRVGSGGETAAGLEALASLDVSYYVLPRQVQLAIQDAVKRICPAPSASPTSCPTSVLCSLMYSVTLLIYDFPPDELDEGIRSMIARLLTSAQGLLKKGVDLTNAERDRMSQFFNCLRVFFPELIDPVSNLPPISLDRKEAGSLPPSRLQVSVVNALNSALRGSTRLEQRTGDMRSADYGDDTYSSGGGEPTSSSSGNANDDLGLLRWGQGVILRQEFLGLKDEVFPVDIAIFRYEKLIALIEIDGPVHYDTQGKLRRGDLMKEVLYKKTYPGVLFARVRYEQVDKFGPQTIGKQLAKYLYLNLRDDAE